MKYLFIILTIWVTTGQLSATRFYVKPGGDPHKSGKNWLSAKNLRCTLAKAKAGDVIWIAQGTYHTSNTADRRESFVVPAGVKIFGGFLGHEKSIRERPVHSYSTLSGDIGRPGFNGDNAHTVVTLLATNGHSSLLDGLKITGGNAQTFTKSFQPKDAGGGLYLLSNQTGATAHEVKNCTFVDNVAHNGGAVFIRGGRPLFTNCSFYSNTADFYGGAVYNFGVNRTASPTFQQCDFLNNASNTGAGLTNNGVNGEASAMLIACSFTDNISLINAAAIYNIKKETGKCETVIEASNFKGNESILGEDIAVLGTAAPAARSGRRGGTLRPVVATRR